MTGERVKSFAFVFFSHFFDCLMHAGLFEGACSKKTKGQDAGSPIGNPGSCHQRETPVLFKQTGPRVLPRRLQNHAGFGSQVTIHE